MSVYMYHYIYIYEEYVLYLCIHCYKDYGISAFCIYTRYVSDIIVPIVIDLPPVTRTPKAPLTFLITQRIFEIPETNVAPENGWLEC